MNFQDLSRYSVRNPKNLQFLNHGCINTFSRLGINLPEYLTAQMEPKACYKNAAKVAQHLAYTTDYDVYYAEGLTSVFGEIPIQHAFVIINVEGINWILDPTMEFALEKSEDDIFSEYYALVQSWPGDEVNDLILKHKQWGPWSPDM